MVDLVKITVKAVKGGNGFVSFRREKYVQFSYLKYFVELRACYGDFYIIKNLGNSIDTQHTLI